MRNSAISAAALAALLAACAPQTAEDARQASAARCERQFGRMAPDPAQGLALCECIVGRLEDRGLEMSDALGSAREEIVGITRSCAAENGIPVAAF